MNFTYPSGAIGQIVFMLFTASLTIFIEMKLNIAKQTINGTTREPVANRVLMNIPMASNVYIGLALTSHGVTLICQAVFSNVTTTGTMSG